MTIWQPDPNETLIARSAVSFATGAATPVAGMRWFRDTGRTDIQDELPGWPEGPRFTVRGKTERRLRSGAKFGASVLLVATLGVLESLAGSGSTGTVATLGAPEDPENEVEDFPVMWAAPGALARSLPWQLDPARRPETDRTHLAVTDRRVLVLGLLNDVDNPFDEVLWETERSHVAAATRKEFSRYDTDFTITFTDGSWCRLAGRDTNCRDDITRALENPLPLMDPDDLTPGQHQAVRELLEGKEPGGTLLIHRRPSGSVYVTYRLHDRVDPTYGIGSAAFKLMDADGQNARFRKGDI
ncbi:hypothetical protein ACFYW8_29280 [Streptomyces sp. NPDC002742]|uniref:hypothetical protein n=1 Tax=Streptomyces sp. NPDC002742 TaxID=3364663 RepID=UPI0036C8F3A2